MEFNSITRGNNINAVRYYLAICILMNHFCILTGVDVAQLPRIFGGAGSFFAISGFLMFPSFEKNSDVKRYLKRRAKRIFPPYFLIVLLAAFGLCFVSSFTISDYFSSSGFWKYLFANLGFMNFLAPDLPGVFTEATNSFAAVNGSLWTMKGEVACYLTVPVIFFIIRRFNISIGRVLQILMLFFGIMYIFMDYFKYNGYPKMDIAARQCMVMFLFYMGGYLNMKLQYLRLHHKPIIIISAAILMFNYVNINWLNWNFPEIGYIAFETIVLPLTSGLMVIACSVTGRWGIIFSKNDAVTYEIYLFHFPVIQLFVYWGIVDKIGFYTSLFSVIIIVYCMAWLSHKYIDGILVPKLFSGNSRKCNSHVNTISCS